MVNFRKGDLPKETKNMYENESIWRKKNWRITLANHKTPIEDIMESIALFDLWSNALHGVESANLMMKEILMDAYISTHFSCYSLYKYAYNCLRSELETSLRLVYFSAHKNEFKWWTRGNEWYREKNNGPDVWGRNYNYFKRLDEFKKFQDMCEENKKLFNGPNVGIKKIYKELSRFIHSSANHFQTRLDRISPEYDINEFNKWYKKHKKLQLYVHIILALGFPEEFKGMRSAHKSKILNNGMDDYYREKIKQTLGM